MKLYYSYNTFGLKEEWISSYLSHSKDFINHTMLGPRQIEAFGSYLRDCEMEEDDRPTAFSSLIKNLKGISVLWSYIYVNLAFNSGIFIFYQHLRKDTFSRDKIIHYMTMQFNKYSTRTISNACTSLISTFEYTPIGSALKIGIVTREKNKRFVKKEGGYPFDPYVVLYALYKFAHKMNEFSIDLDQIEEQIFSPQKVLVIETKYVKKVLLEIDEPDLLTTSLEEKSLIVRLNQALHPYEILNRYIQREKL